MDNAFFFIPKEEDESSHICGGCQYQEPSFNLLWCRRKEKSVTITDTCSSWTRKFWLSEEELEEAKSLFI